MMRNSNGTGQPSSKFLALTLGSLSLTAVTTASAATGGSTDLSPAPKQGIGLHDEPDLSILDLAGPPSAEEQMVSGGLPATPESGSENPEDLLKSSPQIAPSKRGKSASAKQADGLPAKLPEMKSEVNIQAPDQLPPVPGEGEEPPTEAAASDQPPLENIPEPETVAELPPPSDSDSDGVSAKRYDRSVPLYERETPTVGVDIHSSLQAFGKGLAVQLKDANGNNIGSPTYPDIRNFGFGFEWQPKIFHPLGIVSIGPAFNLYFLSPMSNVTSSAFSLFSVGGSIKYQLNVMNSQILVPFVGYEVHQLRYNFMEATGLGTGWTTSAGPTFGAMLLLNWMEPSAAHNLFSDHGVRRSYLVGEGKMLKSDFATLDTIGTSIYFGLRMEY